MDIVLMQPGHPLWNRTASFARNCSWKAGAFLADRMIKNEFRDWERVIAAVDNDRIAGYCTFSEKDELPDEYGYSPFVGFVFVDERYRGRRISEQMINCACDYAEKLGYSVMYIMSGEQGLYEKYGFKKIGKYKTIHGTTDQLFQKTLAKADN